MLQGRLFSYPDTHRHRLGANFDHIPINCPYRTRVANYLRDGPANVKGNQGSGSPNYEPNSFNGPVEDPTKAIKQFQVSGQAGRFKHSHPNTDFEQPRALYRKVMNDYDREHLITNIVDSLGQCKRDVSFYLVLNIQIKEKMVRLFFKIDPDYGERVAKGVGIPVELAKM